MHIRKTPSGKWRVIVQQNGERRQGTAATRAEAERLGATLIVQLGGEPVGDDRRTVGELLDIHLAEHRYAPTTRAEVERIRGLVPDWFAARQATAVTPPIVDTLYRQLEADGWTVFRTRRLHVLILGAFKRARRKGWVTENPAHGAHIEPEPEPKTRVPELDEVNRLLAAADAHSEVFGIYCRLAAATGARRGELVGLQWGDIDLERLEIRIRRAVTYTPASGVVVDDVKGRRRARRAIAIGPRLAARLDAFRIAQGKEQLGRGRRPGDDGWLFSHPGLDRELPWLPDSATKMWSEVRHAAGITDIRLHDLRHFVGTELIDAGFNAKQVGGRLGHTKVATTEDRYVHARRARDREAGEHMDGRVG